MFEILLGRGQAVAPPPPRTTKTKLELGTEFVKKVSYPTYAQS